MEPGNIVRDAPSTTTEYQNADTLTMSEIDARMARAANSVRSAADTAEAQLEEARTRQSHEMADLHERKAALAAAAAGTPPSFAECAGVAAVVLIGILATTIGAILHTSAKAVATHETSSLATVLGVTMIVCGGCWAASLYRSYASERSARRATQIIPF